MSLSLFTEINPGSLALFEVAAGPKLDKPSRPYMPADPVHVSFVDAANKERIICGAKFAPGVAVMFRAYAVANNALTARETCPYCRAAFTPAHAEAARAEYAAITNKGAK